MGSSGMQDFTLPWIETPLLESSILSRAAGCRIFLKLENLQPASSFKSRGIGNLILQQVAHHGHGSAEPSEPPLVESVVASDFIFFVCLSYPLCGIETLAQRA